MAGVGGADRVVVGDQFGEKQGAEGEEEGFDTVIEGQRIGCMD